MKEIFKLFLITLLIFSICACSSSPDEAESNIFTTEASASKESINSNFVDPIKDWFEYDNLISEIKTTDDYGNRVELMHKAEDMLMNSGCVIPLYYFSDTYMVKPHVEGIFSNNLGYKFFKNTNITNDSTTLRVSIAGEPLSIDPALFSSPEEATLSVNLFAGLYTYDSNGNIVADLATGYTKSDKAEDGSVTYTVTLCENLKWSDGSPLTANDFVESWQQAANSKIPSSYGYLYSLFKGYPSELDVKATDDKTIIFTLTAPCAYIESLLASPIFFPVKQTDDESTYQNAGFISNGPFICTNWKHNSLITLEKNPNYHKASEVSIDKIEFVLSTNTKNVYTYYIDGNLDFIDALPTDIFETLKISKEFNETPIIGTFYLSFNAKSKIFEGKTAEEATYMRLAFNSLIDRQYICNKIVYDGVSANSIIPIATKDGNGGTFKVDNNTNKYFDEKLVIENYQQNLENARDYLRKAGYTFDNSGKLSKETPINIVYLTNDSTEHVAIAKRIQADFDTLGISMTIRPLEGYTFLQERKEGNYDLVRDGWYADFSDPISILELFTTTSEKNHCHFG